jgi:hypothetical protein
MILMAQCGLRAMLMSPVMEMDAFMTIFLRQMIVPSRVRVPLTSIFSGRTTTALGVESTAISIEGVVPSAPIAEARAPDEKTPTVGHVFSIALLIVVGMAFWVRSAYVEKTLVTLSLEELDDEYDTGSMGQSH